jgi:hypothetical protein
MGNGTVTHCISTTLGGWGLELLPPMPLAMIPTASRYQLYFELSFLLDEVQQLVARSYKT